MMQVVPKWRVILAGRESAPPLVLFISDQFLSNVLRKLADIELQDEPTDLQITLVDDPKTVNVVG
jgi:hypothetical protein